MLQPLLDQLIASGQERGLQLAAYLNGKLVISACAGLATKAQPVTPETLFLSFSCGKGVSVTLVHQLVAAGLLAYDTPVAAVWPAFGAQGKACITLQQVLCHTAGVPQLPVDLDIQTLCDQAQLSAIVAGLSPLWEPGSQTGYHAITQGVILLELCQRASGKSYAALLDEYIRNPLGLTGNRPDLMFGLPASEQQRLAWLDGLPAPWLQEPAGLMQAVIPVGVTPGPLWNQLAVQQTVLPASNLFTTAEGLARFYAALCPAGADGIKLLSDAQREQVTRLQTAAPDRVLGGRTAHKGLGYRLGEPGTALGERLTVFGHPGAGGSIGFADPEHNFSFALLKNQLSWLGPEDTDVQIAQWLRQELGLPA